MKTYFAALTLAAFLFTACSKPAETQAEAPNAAFSQEDADFGLRLALLEGHMNIGRELAQAGQTDNALPHFGHPVRELYGDLRPVIEARHAEQFQGDLVALESLAALEPNSERFNTAFDTAIAKVHAARDTIPAATRDSDAYIVHLASDIATVASQEYRNALVAGRVDSLIEYHDARGFIFYATEMLAAHGDGADPKVQQASDVIAALHAMLAPLDPPNPPAATDAQFEAEAARLRDIAAAP